ncbi:WD repeat-containing protein 59-like isoform X5 [Dinothrombium tinctorium]|uniref:WD repeat-containing protein 59-like isoform X5 n=1 Tax=Dinothrombium tinctorium TaxID=1965070 RepID=A0A443RS13_9ACAR|nr:WD repeat-containing protein 59-like isoform X5 [Dinothrombium tinctorium]
MSIPTSPVSSPMSSNSLHQSSASSDALTPADLQQEFSLINLNIDNLTLEEMNASKRYCVICASNNLFTCKLKIEFPSSYPYDVPPTFTFIENGEKKQLETGKVSNEIKSKLLLSLQNTAHIQVKRNRPCLEPCLRDFMATFDKLTNLPQATAPVSVNDYSTLSDSFLDAHVPFPKTCGATFCGADLLVCFARPPHLQQMNAATECTPRALSALSAYLQTAGRSSSGMTNATNVATTMANLRNANSAEVPTTIYPQQSTMSISSFYYNYNNRKKSRHRSMRKNLSSSLTSSQNAQPVSSRYGFVYVFSVAGILPCSRILAENYVFCNDVTEMCQRNAAAAAANNNKELVQTWTLAALCADATVNSNFANNMIMESPWSVHPSGRKLIQSLIDHYLNVCGDFQTAAMLCCAFSGRCTSCGKMSCVLKPCKSQLNNSSPTNSPGNSPYHTVNVPSTISNAAENPNWDEWNLVESLKRHRSNSWSDSIENYFFTTTAIQSSPYQSPGLAYRFHCNEMTLFREQREAEKHEFNTKLIDPKLMFQYDCIKQVYADLLIRWGLYKQRAQLLKYVSSVNNFQLEMGWKWFNFTSICQKCRSHSQSSQCHNDKCKDFTLRCVVCRTSVKGAATFCMACGHGGHTLHLSEWFSKMDECASGCGCRCLSYDVAELLTQSTSCSCQNQANQ